MPHKSHATLMPRRVSFAAPLDQQILTPMIENAKTVGRFQDRFEAHGERCDVGATRLGAAIFGCGVRAPKRAAFGALAVIKPRLGNWPKATGDRL